MSRVTAETLEQERLTLECRLARLLVRQSDELAGRVFSAETVRSIQATDRAIDFIDQQLALTGGQYGSDTESRI